MPRESDIYSAILARIRARGGFAEKLHGGPYQRKGLPDIVAVIDGLPVWIETKIPGEVPTPAQAQVLRELRDAGAWAGWLDSAQAAHDLIADPARCCRTCLQRECRCGDRDP